MSTLAASYAEALYSVVREKSAQKEALGDLMTVKSAFDENPRFTAILRSPEISREEKRALLDTCFAGAQRDTLNCVKLLCDKGHISEFASVCARFKHLYDEEMGILTVKVTSSAPLSDGQTARLREKLEKLCEKRVELVFFTDPGCLGGVRVEYGGVRIDDTLKNRLSKIGRLLENTSV